ncbi:hypothetical protein [Brevundimonas sp.]|uniref:hypothetical protein n=1 Tax=Brevundimonas sp. TaxID=1871086 RepID=UPI002D31E716|nr:hypothetical protein [Brevundimonas sp.]HYC68101.1 hypothetical protein [Brevundimonas sp.]
MLSTLAIAISFGSASPAHVAPQSADVGELVRQACVETGMRRNAFETLGRERRWRQARLTSDSSAPESWTLAFRIDGGLVMLSYDPRSGASDLSVGSVCSVSVDRAAPGLADEMASLAASLGLGDESPFVDQPPGAAPMRIWSRFGDKTLTYAAAPDGRAVVSLSRQVVSTLPASPPGN